MANVYHFTVAQLHGDRVVLHGYMTSHTKSPQQPTEIELRGDGVGSHFSGIGQRVDVDMTLTPYINGVAQTAVTP